MRKVELSLKEKEKYKIIKKLVETNGNKERARIKLGLKSIRQINRLIAGYKEYGKEFFVHGNRGRKPSHALSDEQKNQIEDLYNTKYFDCTYTQFTEFLQERENISISIDEVRCILKQRYILSPRSHKATRRNIKKLLLQQKQKATSKKEIAKIQANIVATEDAHPRQPRCIYYLFKADRITIFDYRRKGTTSDEDNTFTQFAYACKQLGTSIETSSEPEFKPRIERLFETLQTRLISELRLANITTIDEANNFLPDFLDKYNSKFALCIDNTKSVFENQPTLQKINLTLAVLSRRIIDTGHSICFKKKHYRTVNSVGTPIYFGKGTKCMVIEAFDKSLFATVEDSIFSLEEIPEVQVKSENFDEILPTEPKKIYIPKMIHPFKRQSFEKFIEKQNLKAQKELEEVS